MALAGPVPLVLLPGAFTDRRLFAHQLDHLGAVADVRCAELADVDTVEAMAEAILAGAPPRFALAGLSLGGSVALEIMKRARERIIQLALLATTAAPDPPAVAAARHAAIARVRGGDFAGQVETVLSVLLGPTTRACPEHVAAVRAMVSAVGADRYARQVEVIANRPAQRAVAAQIRCPTLVLAGRDDPVTSVDGHRALAGSIHSARLAVVEQAGHLAPLDQPVAVTALLRDWLVYPG